MNTNFLLKTQTKLIVGVFAGLAVGVYSTPILASKPILSIFKKSTEAVGISRKNTQILGEITVKGSVIDATTKEPLAGCNILVKNSKKGTNADANGNFTIITDENATLIFTFIGYEKQEIALAGKSKLTVALKSTASDLAQVVVIGYGSTTKKDVTGSVKSLKSAEFNQGIINSPEQLLQGKVSGVNVTSASGEPGGIQNISVRGPGGVRTGSTPLFVVDGLALDNSSTGGATNPLNFLNPQDIESIDVLKDASATAIYGSRGANGVILITTKKGKTGFSTVNYSTSYGVSSLNRALPIFSADEYRKQVPAVGGILEDLKASTDWQKEITRTALTKNHNISLGGGAEKLTYYASFGIQNQEGIIKNNQLDRYTGRINVTQKLLDDRLTIDANLNVTNTNNERPPITSVVGTAISTNPTYPAYDDKGNVYSYVNGVNPLTTLKL
jgi:iron complex outermembrane receptor protein